MFDNSSILITGGTGSFGKKFVRMTLDKFNPKAIIIYSRDEMKQWDMAESYSNDQRVKFIIGDVRDKERLSRSLDGVDYVVHAAATKIVPTAEYNPFECVKTNINGAMNVIDSCTDKKILSAVALSTDKASNPINLYGATKLASDKLFVASNSSYVGNHKTCFSIVRYGNVMGSRGSVIPFFKSLLEKGSKTLPITHFDMTRFLLSLEQATDLIQWSYDCSVSHGKIAIPKVKSFLITDIARCLAKHYGREVELEEVGIRPGEKIHEEMISSEEWLKTEDAGENYLINQNVDFYSPGEPVSYTHLTLPTTPYV